MSEPEITCTRVTIWALIAIVLQITGLSVFVLGFFPVKPTLSGFSGPESYFFPQSDSVDAYNGTAMGPEELRSLYQELSQVPSSYDRMILLVIDGLPAEFVLGKDGQPPPKSLMNAMPYTQLLLENGDAAGYHATAAAPTVTMPRLKAMVSGAIGGFLDVVFNFNTQAFSDDNLLAQFFKIGWKMVMLGDETWLKLFPQYFVRQDGVSSFFVKDTVQVDHNVSRHLPYELEQDDWQLLILHYLGVDHVGHIGGRRSVLMTPKLKEMDDVIKLIHQNNIRHHGKDKGRTLLVVVSDHGMTDNGNHGGSSYEETDALLLFVGLASRYSERASANDNIVKQVDITPTLALLFGVPIPINNVGSLIAGSLNHLTDDKYLRALELNSRQLLRLLGAQLPYLSCLKSAAHAQGDYLLATSSTCEELEALEEKLCCLYSTSAVHHSFWESKNSSRSYSDDYRKATAAYFDFLEAASEWLSRRVTDKPMELLIVGIIGMFLSTFMFLRILYYLRQEEKLKQIQGSDLNRSVYTWSADEIYILTAILLLVVSMGSSSMVEEEQYTWHFFTMTFYLILLHKRIKSLAFGVHSCPGIKHFNYSCIFSIILLLLSTRIMRGWHQGGVNWTYYPDISKWLEQSGSNWIKAVQLLAGILVLSSGLLALNKSKLNTMLLFLIKWLFFTVGLLVLQHLVQFQDNSFLTASHSATLMAQLIYAGLVGLAFFTVIISPWVTSSMSYGAVSTTAIYLEQLRASLYLNGLVCTLCWSLLQLLIQQAVNSMPVFLLLVQILATMSYFRRTKLFHMQWVEVATLFFLGMSGHFGLGNTNTLATIDVAGAFIGISSHSTFLSGVLMFCITYASPMMALLSLVLYISVKDEYSSQTVDSTLKMIFTPCLVPLGINSVLLTAYTLVLLQMRNHLFIWSVFSPKYMYVCATTACIYIGLLMVALIEGYTVLVFALRSKL